MTGGTATQGHPGQGIEHVLALDGLRAIAVTAVVLFHLDRLPGGNLGVDAFFVLSGWLITTRLLRGSERSPGRRIDLGAFWAGRIRRLFPASLAVLAVVSVVWTIGHIDVPSLPRDLLWALGWSSNWGTITSGGDYWARFGEPSPVAHFWSLAVEEQFYVVWPLVLYPLARFGAGRRDALVGVVSAALAVGSVAFMVLTFDPASPTATYLHTAARAHSLLIGAVGAALTASAARRAFWARAARRAVPAAACIALTLVAVSSEGSTWLYAWGFPVFALAIAVLVVAAADGGLSRSLGARPLRWVGDRSYAIYLWHWPVILFLRGERAPVHGLPLDLLRVAVTVALAAASYRWLEMPIRERRLARRPIPALALGLTVAVAALLVVRVPAPPAPRTVVSEVRLPAETPVPAPSLAAMSSLSALPTTPTRFIPVVPPPPKPAVRVLVVGDSTAVRLAEGLLPYAADHRDTIQAGSAAYSGCGLSVADDGRMHGFSTDDGQGLIDLHGCTEGWGEILDRVASDEHIDIVLVDIASWDGVDIHFPDGRVVSVLDPVGRQLVTDAYRQFVSQVESTGTRVVWVTPADIHLAWGGIDSPLDDQRRWESVRSIIDTLPVEQIDLPGWLRRQEIDDATSRPDGVHLTVDVNARFVAEMVAPTLIHLGPSEPEPVPAQAG